ncbi:hypothetical protein [Rhodovulum marinum]|uniref:Uncharacterized protein n=1 Tax=Rhodovulum marinum TaxID=320662 RepID=A0A4R2Q991_9RHOB|nr:hypothetical protein [Rhodovulum marinum]TCP43361.1 hypothetical protein EV662_102559 [Rhodovulum marinum]
MSDAHLTDHEWKLKMAREGKAIYVPGKTDEQVKAELKAETMTDPKDTPVTFTVTERDLEHYYSAFYASQKALHKAVATLEHLAQSDDDALGATGWAVAELAAKGLEEMAEAADKRFQEFATAVRLAAMRSRGEIE